MLLSKVIFLYVCEYESVIVCECLGPYITVCLCFVCILACIDSFCERNLLSIVWREKM